MRERARDYERGGILELIVGLFMLFVWLAKWFVKGVVWTVKKVVQLIKDYKSKKAAVSKQATGSTASA